MLKINVWFAILMLLSTSWIEGHFLWKIDSDKPSYLYGTVHSSDPRVRELPGEVTEALITSDSFHPELELSPENIGRMTAAIFTGAEGDLKHQIPEDLWQRLLQNSQQIGIPVALLRRVPVQLAPLLFASPPEADFDQVIDVQVHELARSNNLSIRPLETVDEQMKVFRSLTQEQALTFLKDALDEYEEGFPVQNQILDLYAAGDLEGLTGLMDEEFARLEMPEFAERLIFRRNEIMAERLLPHLAKGGAFAAVGVGHMPGERGIITLLEEQGYQITRVPLRRENARE